MLNEILFPQLKDGNIGYPDIQYKIPQLKLHSEFTSLTLSELYLRFAISNLLICLSSVHEMSNQTCSLHRITQ